MSGLRIGPQLMDGLSAGRSPPRRKRLKVKVPTRPNPNPNSRSQYNASLKTRQLINMTASKFSYTLRRNMTAAHNVPRANEYLCILRLHIDP